MTTQLAERSILAFLDGDDSLEIDNIIHSTAGAAQFGYSGPLVGGVTVYAWAAPAIIEALGEDWLDHGWSDFRLRRPVYPGDEITTRVSRNDDGGCEFTMAKETGEVCIAGMVGLGDADWLGELSMPQRRDPAPAAEQHTLLTPETLPLGEDLPPMAVSLSVEEAESYADEFARDAHPRWRGPDARIHTGWIAGRPTRLLRHTYDYHAAIHAASRIQQLAPARAGQTLVVAGHIPSAYQRKGHEYALNDIAVYSERGELLTRIRQTSIYQVAAR